MSEKIPRGLMEEIERELPTGLNVNRDPHNPEDTIRIVAFQRSEDTERRDENHNKLDRIRRDFDWGDADKDFPVTVVDVSDVETRYSQVFIRVEINW